MKKDTDYNYVEALIKVESTDVSFTTRYEWILLQVDNSDEKLALESAQKYLSINYNRSYQGDFTVTLSVVKIIAVNPSIENSKKEVIEVYSLPFTDLASFEKWRHSYE